jgi:hypothetical protein
MRTLRTPISVRKSSPGAALAALVAVVIALGSAMANVACGSDEAGRAPDPEQADAAAADNPAAASAIDDPGLGDKSPGQPSPWDHIDQPVKTQAK